MNDPLIVEDPLAIKDILGASEAAQMADEIGEELDSTPRPMNRRDARAHIRRLRRMVVKPDRDTRMFQALQPENLTKLGAARLRKRRAKAKAARAARKRNRSAR